MIALVSEVCPASALAFSTSHKPASVASTQLDMSKSGSDSAAIAAVGQSELGVEDHKDVHTESGDTRQDAESSPAQKKKKQKKKKKKTLSAQMTATSTLSEADERVKDGGCASDAKAERGGSVLMVQEAPGTAGSAAHVMTDISSSQEIRGEAEQQLAHDGSEESKAAQLSKHDESGGSAEAKTGSVCGYGGCGAELRKPLLCARCKVVAYCCKECQIKDWKAGHKQACKSRVKAGNKDVAADLMLHLEAKLGVLATSPLHDACRKGDVKTVDKLLQSDLRNIDSPDEVRGILVEEGTA